MPQSAVAQSSVNKPQREPKRAYRLGVGDMDQPWKREMLPSIIRSQPFRSIEAAQSWLDKPENRKVVRSYLRSQRRSTRWSSEVGRLRVCVFDGQGDVRWFAMNKKASKQ